MLYNLDIPVTWGCQFFLNYVRASLSFDTLCPKSTSSIFDVLILLCIRIRRPFSSDDDK